ncbi:phage tail tube protein [Aristophania vespae]|uniref:phage tail tube protein n=1 Tax=Aristophania vespae TaxID=2697033 RepID=UPI002351614C|nr:phage tail tube protein [Aristophania vespae]UMM63098.1 hypothetical protein DM15PD_00520 [Aristophania vespae]
MEQYTGATKGYFAAYQANDAIMALAMEDKYGVVSTKNYQQVRLTGENFRAQTQTARPDEINSLAEASQSVITQVAVSGTLTGALSYGTYDDLLAAVVCGDWQGNVLKNDKMVKTWTITERMGDRYFIRSGSFCTKAQLTFSQGNFASVEFDFTCAKQDSSDTSPASITPVNDNLIINTLSNFKNISFDDQVFTSGTRELTLTIERNGSASDYAMGSIEAVGIRPGETQLSAQVQVFFNNWNLYHKYENGWRGKIVAEIQDDNGQGYKFTILNALLTNPVINAGSKNSSIVATFDIDAGPQAGGGTIQIERFKPQQPTPPQPTKPEQTASTTEDEK